MICIIDYQMGNVGSIKNSLEFLKIKSIISNKNEDIINASHLILPGVGSFKAGMEHLKKLNLIELLNEEVIEKQKPLLGICLGMQLLAEKGEEKGNTNGLGWIKGTVQKIEHQDLLIPHIGWNDIMVTSSSKLFTDIESHVFYFVHSFVLKTKDNKAVISTCCYGNNFVAAVQKNNIMGVQFHPERSQKSGLKILQNFSEIKNA